jgi:hypothetical protein
MDKPPLFLTADRVDSRHRQGAAGGRPSWTRDEVFPILSVWIDAGVGALGELDARLVSTGHGLHNPRTDGQDLAATAGA